ncbi:uncharacterized protein BKA78DRAFT_313344, partial [Phyllosticta capitalensis]|uniref:uncharacterized protein n=1 Tax=Phyllosticta capitalensis TaxID=121624 RepID=UPI003130B23F
MPTSGRRRWTLVPALLEVLEVLVLVLLLQRLNVRLPVGERGACPIAPGLGFSGGVVLLLSLFLGLLGLTLCPVPQGPMLIPGQQVLTLCPGLQGHVAVEAAGEDDPLVAEATERGGCGDLVFSLLLLLLGETRGSGARASDAGRRGEDVPAEGGAGAERRDGGEVGGHGGDGGGGVVGCREKRGEAKRQREKEREKERKKEMGERERETGRMA